MSDELDGAPRPLLRGLPAGEAERAADLLATSVAVVVEAGTPYFRASFPSASLLLIEQGFVVVRASFPPPARSVITCEAGPGRIVLPPAHDEVLFGLGSAAVTSISAEGRDQLLALPAVARSVVEQMVFTLGQKQQAIANLSQTRHVERVRRKLLQLALSYGRVGADGIRIDFPISHSLLAEMIGSSRETVTRAVDALQRDRFVTRRGHAYWLLVSPEAVLPARWES